MALAVREYERLAIRAAVEQSSALARLARLVYLLFGDWEPASWLNAALIASGPEHLSDLC